MVGAVREKERLARSQAKLFPSTRYQGSKRKLLEALAIIFKDLPVGRCLDAFGGTGSVTHLLRSMGHDVSYNDILYANEVIARALFSYSTLALCEEDIHSIFERASDRVYKQAIQRTYQGIYFLDEENEALDIAVQNIPLLERQKADELWYLLFQSMLSKRPYNLFHRANLNLRTRSVKRSFGNKVTWDRSLLDHMKKFYRELRAYRDAFPGPEVRIHRSSVFELSGTWDLVYLDPPYARSEQQGPDNYFNFYHFLDAVLHYDDMEDKASTAYNHRPIYHPQTSWYESATIETAFLELFKKFYPATLVVSYRNDGIPEPETLCSLAASVYKSVELQDLASYQYALSSRNKETKEIVLIARSG